MQIAYIISAYKLPQQVVRLVRRLNTDTASFFLHVDRKSCAAVYDSIVQGLADLANVHFLRRHTCYWGGFGHVAATLEGIKAITGSGHRCDYVVLLTGQDYPIKTTAYIEKFLCRSHDASFIDYFPLPTTNWEHGGLDRLLAWHLRVFGRHLGVPSGRYLLPERKLPYQLRPFGGSSYWCLPRECVEYVGAFTASHRRYVDYFRFVNVPDELFFQTIIMNSPFAESVVNDNLRLIEWKDPNAGSPAVLTTDDFLTIARSEKLFARKFDVTQDEVILDLIDRRILGYA